MVAVVSWGRLRRTPSRVFTSEDGSPRSPAQRGPPTPSASSGRKVLQARDSRDRLQPGTAELADEVARHVRAILGGDFIQRVNRSRNVLGELPVATFGGAGYLEGV